MEKVIEHMPSVTSLHGFIFYSVIAYIISITFSICMSRFVANNLDVEESVKKTIRENRSRQDKKKELINEFMQIYKQAGPPQK